MTNMDTSVETMKDPAAVIEQARSLILDKDYDQATELLGTIGHLPEAGGDVLCLYGVIAYKLGDYAMSIQMFRRAETLPPLSGDLYEVLAVLFAVSGNLTDALFYGKLSTTREKDDKIMSLLGAGFPTFSDVFTDIKENPFLEQGKRLLASGNVTDGVRWLEQHLSLNPRDQEATRYLVDGLMAAGHTREAISHLRALVAGGDVTEHRLSTLGRALTSIGAFAESEACHRHAIRENSVSVGAWAGQAMDLAYSPYRTPEQTDAVLSALRDSVRSEAAALSTNPAGSGGSGKTLTIGYLVSEVADRNDAAVLSEVLANHDRSRFSAIGIGSGDLSMPRNAVYRNGFDRWKNIRDIDPYTLAAMLSNDGVDILVDLSGLSAPANLPLIAARTAPVQVSWFGSPVGLGAEGYDFRFVEPGTPADGAGGAKDMPLDGGLYCFRRTYHALAEQTPFDVNGYVCFGADVGLAELNADVVETWARILADVPNSQLLLNDRDMQHPSNIERLLDLFGNFGMAQRVDVVTATDRGEFFREVDIALTAFPYARPHSAATAVSGGLPVVALNMTGSPCADVAHFLTRMGHGKTMVADSLDDYVQKAVSLGVSPEDRSAVRGEPWSKLSEAVPFDAAAFTEALENAYVEMWKEKTGG